METNYSSKPTGVSMEAYFAQGDSPRPRAEDVAKTLKWRSNINLEKSIQILNEAVSPSLNQTSRTPRRSLRNYSFSHDMSDAHRFPPGRTKTVEYTQPLNNSSSREFGPFTGQFAEVTGVQLTEEITLSNATYIDDEDPGQKASADLFETFSACLKRNPAPHQVMNLLQDYVLSCEEQVMKLQSVVRRVPRNKSRFTRTIITSDVLSHEKQTWTLFHCLYKDRIETDEKENAMEEEAEEDTLVWSLSEQNVVNRLFEKDPLVRQSQLVVDWLEKCASEIPNDSHAGFFMEQHVAWENTLHNLQKRKGGVKSSSRRSVTEMDPDAPCRQKVPLDDLDMEDEKHFLKNLFSLIRSGQLEKAQNLCQTCGQTWRAATLEGWRLFHDPNYYGATNLEDIRAVEGNPHRAVWKSVCWGMASEPSLDQYERATYAALSGNLMALLPVCKSWLDYVWAYFKVMVDTKVEQEVQLLCTLDHKLENMPEDHTMLELDPLNIFKDISASTDENVRLQSEDFYHVIQKYIILGNISGLIEVMYDWVQSERDSLSSHQLRLMAHIILFMKTLGLPCQEELCEAILKVFVNDLIKNKHRDIIAHYVSTLRPDSQVECYATFLEDIEDQEERQKCLQRAEEEDLDVAQIAKTVVERIRFKKPASFPFENSLAPNLTITEEDKDKINAVDWLIFNEHHRPEALKQANAIMRSFIAVNKHTAARQVFEKLPPNTIDTIYRLWNDKTGSGELLPSDNNAIREYLCMKAYLDAVESFNDWFSLFHKGQPNHPGTLEVGASFTDRVAHEHKMKQFNLEKERWMHNLLGQTKTTKDRIYNVLLFADGGWLVDSCEDPDDEYSRQEQLKNLRKLHLPRLCLNLHSVLHSSGLYPEAVQIADIVASCQHQLYKDFSKEDLQRLLAQICTSSERLLDDNKDPLGYDMV